MFWEKNETNQRQRVPEKTWKESVKEFLWALFFALILATLVRQMWFEAYQIPSGSMRPTFKEQDKVIVSQLAFGLNVPLAPKHFYFDEDLLQRGQVVTFTVEDMPVTDPDTIYFGLFPGKKRFIKRLVGKGGDTLYFYGGHIYGIDREKKPLPLIDEREYVPYSRFYDRTEGKPGQVVHFLNNQARGRITMTRTGQRIAEIFDGERWKKELIKKTKGASIEAFADYMGIGNFAMARLKERATGAFVLDLFHHQSMALTQRNPQRAFHRPDAFVTSLVIDQEHMIRLMHKMTTGRFVVENGLFGRWTPSGAQFEDLKLKVPPSIPDGVYEFFDGVAYEVSWTGLVTILPQDHPIFSTDGAWIAMLFNLGASPWSFYLPVDDDPVYIPHRFAYFRDGSLYVGGGLFLEKGEDMLAQFNENEKKRSETSLYVPFCDEGPPIKDGKLDVDFITRFGVHIPEGHVFCLGDNHAGSGDCREFGFVPVHNLRGSPLCIVWPFGERFGAVPQVSGPVVNPQRLFVWALVSVIALIWNVYKKKRVTTL